MKQDWRILLVRLSAIGEIVFASPLVAAFRRAYARAHIAWRAQPECAPLLAHHPDLDEIIESFLNDWKALFQARRFTELFRALRRFRAELSARGFDLAVDLQGLMKSGLLTRLSGAPERIGLGSREGSDWLMTRVLPRGEESERIGSEYLFLAQALGLPSNNFDMAIHYGAEEADFAAKLIEREGLTKGFAVFCPFTTRPQKHWLEARWAKLADRLRAETGLPAVLLGGPADRKAAGRIRELGSAAPIDLAGETTLLQAAAMIDRSTLLVGVDTGLSHMGIAFGRV